MSKLLSEVQNKTVWTSYVVSGDGNSIFKARNWPREPTTEMLSEQLVEFNFPRQFAFRLSRVVVVKTVTTAGPVIVIPEDVQAETAKRLSRMRFEQKSVRVDAEVSGGDE